MNYAITGGVGFIGSNFVRFLASQKDIGHILVIDNLKEGSNLDRNLPEELGPQYKFIYKNMADVTVRDLSDLNIDVVVNFAAQTHVDRSITSPTYFLETNVIDTQKFLHTCYEYGKLKLFYHVSTDEVYGDLPLGALDDEDCGGFAEHDALLPNNIYSASKVATEAIVKAYHCTFELPVLISRCSNNYGPNQDDEKFLPTIIKNLKENKKIPLYGTGKNIREWLYVEDHCFAIYNLIELYLNGKIGNCDNPILRRENFIDGYVYNIGPGTKNAFSNIDIIKKAINAVGLKGDYKNYYKHVDDRKGHDMCYLLNTNKLEVVFKYHNFFCSIVSGCHLFQLAHLLHIWVQCLF